FQVLPWRPWPMLWDIGSRDDTWSLNDASGYLRSYSDCHFSFHHLWCLGCHRPDKGHFYAPAHASSATRGKPTDKAESAKTEPAARRSN
ncbi:MAG: hypothetical protein ACYSP9_06015, partial [Planctomycetota bacterium]